MLLDEALAPVDDLFPLGHTTATASGTDCTLGLLLAEPITATHSEGEPELTYSEDLQIAMVDGVPAIESPAAEQLVMKKANTVEDSQTWPDEVAK